VSSNGCTQTAQRAAPPVCINATDVHVEVDKAFIITAAMDSAAEEGHLEALQAGVEID
jgi:hypothetical protein